MTAVKEDLSNNNTINWIPESIGKECFGDWLENVHTWGFPETVTGVHLLISGNVNADICTLLEAARNLWK